jgi:hypothetical protein
MESIGSNESLKFHSIVFLTQIFLAEIRSTKVDQLVQIAQTGDDLTEVS